MEVVWAGSVSGTVSGSSTGNIYFNNQYIIIPIPQSSKKDFKKGMSLIKLRDDDRVQGTIKEIVEGNTVDPIYSIEEELSSGSETQMLMPYLLIDNHNKSGKLATLTAVQPPGRFGVLDLEGSQVKSFQEKPVGENSWISGGFFVLEPSVIDFIDGDDCVWEEKPLKILSQNNELNAYKHHGFWQPMDTLRDHRLLQKKWDEGEALWKTWK